MSLLREFWPGELETPHLALEDSFETLERRISQLPDGELSWDADQEQRPRLTFEGNEFRCWATRDPDTSAQGLLGEIEDEEAPIGRKQLIPVARGGDADKLFISLKDGSVHYREDPESRFEKWADSLGEFLSRLQDNFDESG